MSEIPKDIVVGSKNGRLAGGKFTHAKWHSKLPKPVVYVVIAVVVIAALAGGWAWYQHHQLAKKAAADKTKSHLVDQASNNLDPQNSSSLESIAKKLEQQPGHDTDPNSLYVLTTYYLNIGDTAKAQDYLTKLKAVYDPAKGFDESLKPITGWMTIDKLEARLHDQQHPKTPTKPMGLGG